MSFFEELKRRNVFRVGIAYGVAAWLLIQIADTVFPRIGLSDSAVTLVIALLALGFIPALIFAWAYEMTPEGLKREKDVDRSQSITNVTGRKLDRMIIGILTVVIALLIFDRFALRDRSDAETADATTSEQILPPPAQSGTSIAVLPFVNMSADPDNEYFSDGISEELLNVLVRVSALHVASRTSSFAYKGKDLPLTQIARELGVNHILEGSVRKADNTVRITAQLIDADADRHLWSDTYERELDDIFDIQEEISDHIVDALKLALDVEEASAIERLQRPTDNPEAYELYLQGRFLWRKRMEDNVRGAIDLLQRAVALDPNFAKAYEALAAAWTVLPSWSDADVAESLGKAVQQANQALMLDPSLAEARAIRAHHLAFQRRWLDALIEFEAALESEPKNAGVRQWYSEALSEAGYLGLAMTEVHKAYEHDPASPVLNNVYSMLATISGDDERAIRHMNKALDLGLTIAWGHPLRALLRTGQWDTIEQLAYQHPLLAEGAFYRDCIEAHRNPALLADVLRKGREQSVSGADVNELWVYCMALAGDLESALDGFEAMLQNDPTDGAKIWSPDPPYVAVRQSQRFRQILADNGFLELYAVRGWPDRCRPAGAEDFVCE